MFEHGCVGAFELLFELVDVELVCGVMGVQVLCGGCAFVVVDF